MAVKTVKTFYLGIKAVVTAPAQGGTNGSPDGYKIHNPPRVLEKLYKLAIWVDSCLREHQAEGQFRSTTKDLVMQASSFQLISLEANGLGGHREIILTRG